LQSVRWADIPQLSIRGWCCPPSWQHYWQQSLVRTIGPGLFPTLEPALGNGVEELIMATPTGPPTGGGAANVAAPTSMPPAKIRPGRVWYWVALAVFLAGVAWAVVAFVALFGRVDSFPRVPDPGQGVISLTHSGGYVIYYEGPGASNGNVPAGGVHVKALSGPGPVNITSFSGSMTYQIGSREGSAVANLQIAAPGRFLVQATSSGAPPGSHLAIGSNLSGGILAAVIPSVVLVLAAIIGAIVVAVVRHTRIRRARLPQLLR